jgi:hypothetical protein
VALGIINPLPSLPCSYEARIEPGKVLVILVSKEPGSGTWVPGKPSGTNPGLKQLVCNKCRPRVQVASSVLGVMQDRQLLVSSTESWCTWESILSKAAAEKWVRACVFLLSDPCDRNRALVSSGFFLAITCI